MSGHSHYATIKRQKETKDAQKGKAFSKLAREIAIAIKTGGGADPEANFKLRVAIDRARAANLPKDNIERAISNASKEGGSLDVFSYEGFGPDGVGIIVEVATDNRNRTGQELKNLFERGGGNLGSPGSVAFNFEAKGLIVVKSEKDTQDQILRLIDLGVEEVEESRDVIEAYVASDKLGEMKALLESNGFEILSYELIRKPKSLQVVSDPSLAQKNLKLLENLENQEDVQRVFTNIDVPDAVLDQMKP